MKANELEFITTELEKCMMKQTLRFEIIRTGGSKPLIRETCFDENNTPINLVERIYKVERILKDGGCLIILKNLKFDFSDDQIQEIWRSLYESVSETLHVESRLRSDGIID